MEGYQKAFGTFREAKDLEDDGFFLEVKLGGVRIIGKNERGALYGAFEYLSRLAQA